MTVKTKAPKEEGKKLQTLDEICENTRAIRRATNRILDHLYEHHSDTHNDSNNSHYDPDELSWEDLYNNDDMYT